MVFLGLKFFDFFRQNKSMPMLTRVWGNWSGSVKQNNLYWGPQSHTVHQGDVLQPALVAVCPHCWRAPGAPLLAQFSKQRPVWGFWDHSPAWTKNSSKWGQPDQLPKDPLDPNRSMYVPIAWRVKRKIEAGCKRWADITRWPDVNQGKKFL